MFRDRVFNVSFLISFLWHMFCIFAVVLVITPKGFTFNKFPTIAFLGPILEDITLYNTSVKSALMPTPYKEDFTRSADAYINEQLFSGDASIYKDISNISEDVGGRIQFHQLDTQKQIADFYDANIESPAETKSDIPQRVSRHSISLKFNGPLAARQLLYSPGMPALPESIIKDQPNFSICMGIAVSPSGAVKGVNKLTTTGYPQIDAVLTSYAAGLVFEPFLDSTNANGSEGSEIIENDNIKIIFRT